MITLQRLALGLLSALFLGGYAQAPALAFLGYVMLVPWSLIYTDRAKGKASVLHFFITAFLAWVFSYAQLFRFGWFVPLAMCVFMIGWWFPFAPILSRLVHDLRLPRSLAVPLAWVTVEWIRATFTLQHFDLNRIGYTQARFTFLIQIADLVGVYGLSFLIAGANGWLADLWFAFRDEGWSLRRAFRRRTVSIGLVVLAATFAMVGAYGSYRLATIHHEPGPKVAIIQPNTPHTMRNMVGVHLTQLLITERNVPDDGGVDLIVWPENAILDFITREGVYLDDLAWLGQKKGAWFVVGALGVSREDPEHTTNSAYLVDPEGNIRGEYAKIMLYPWSEYVPADDFLRRWAPGLARLHRSLVRAGWGFLPSGRAGHDLGVFEMPWQGRTIRFAPLICVENTYPPLPSGAGRLGTDFFLNITSEGEVGGAVQEVLLRIAMVRAVENRMSYVRVGNTGISTMIDSVGRRVALLRGEDGRTINTQGVLIDRVPLSDGGITPYSRSRDAFVKLVALVTFLLYGASFIPRVRAARAAAVAMVLGIATLGSGCGGVPALGDDPAKVEEELSRGRALARAGRCEPAMRPLLEACATAEGCRLAMDSLARCYGQTQRTEEGAAVFAEIGTRYPELRGRALGFEGYFLKQSLELREARERYRESIRLDPSPEVYGRLANLSYRLGDAQGSIDTLRAGLERFPDDAQLRFLLGRMLRIQRRYDEALEVLEALLRDHPDHGPAWVNVGRIRIVQGDTERGATDFRNALRFDRDNIEARFMLARLAFRRGDLETVETMIRQIRRVEQTLGRGPRED